VALNIITHTRTLKFTVLNNVIIIKTNDVLSFFWLLLKNFKLKNVSEWEI
jgi:hypothetical protein